MFCDPHRRRKTVNPVFGESVERGDDRFVPRMEG